MKAIVLVNKKSAYANLNGLTYNIKSIYASGVDLDVNGVTTSFGFSEVLIVDLQTEMQKFFDLYNWDNNTTFLKLQMYCEIKNYKVDVVINCPA